MRRCDVAAALLIVALGAGLYSRTLDVPWYLDDLNTIVRNQAIRDFGRAALLHSTRPIVDWTFSLNYRIHELAVPGYHVANITIHILASMLVYLLAKRAFPTSAVRSLLAALIFVAHPLQTQAVTYVCQRYTSLCALFVFAAIYCLVRARERLDEGGSALSFSHLAWYGAASLASVAALYSKENGILVPVLFLLFAHFFLPRRQVRSWIGYVLPLSLVLAPAVFLQGTFATLIHGGRTLQNLGAAEYLRDGAALASTSLDSFHYFLTEVEVFWRYVRLFFVPVGQVLDFAYPASMTFSVRTGVALAGIAALLVLAYLGRSRAPRFAFGVLWLLVALSPESTVLVLDTYFEHRMYLPMFGLAILVASCPGRAGVIVPYCGVLALCLLTLRRNEQWRDPAVLHAEDIRNGSQSYGSIIALGNVLYERGELAQARAVYDPFVRRADATCTSAPCDAKFLMNVAVALERLDRHGDALKFIRKAIDRGGANSLIYYNAGVAQYRMGDLNGARASFDRAWRMDRSDADALFNYCLVALQLGDRGPAIELLPYLRGLNREHALELEKELKE
jgi:tetratricopeptide (TPR) repeat protein